MVIVRLMGGVGNQMFQYAAARRLALALHVPLKLDITWFARSQDRAYALGGLNVGAGFATADELRQITGSSNRKRARFVSRLTKGLGIGGGWSWLYEGRLSPVDQRVLNARGNVYLDGYWQSERYFHDIADTIRAEFATTGSPDPRSRPIADHIATTASVSVHVRRGDYVSDPRKRRVRSVCTPDYYRRCVAHVAARVADPHLFLFSDDPAWVAANLRLERPTTVVSHDPSRGVYEDLRLMTACRYHVIANSSFSWWGAWLDPRPDKVVFAPRHWMNDHRVDDRDVVPPAWIRV